MDRKEPLRAQIKTVFLERLLAEMAARGLRTGEELARFVGVTKGTGYSWLGPSGLPDATSLWKLCETTSTNADWWLGRSDAREAPGVDSAATQLAHPGRAEEAAQAAARRANAPTRKAPGRQGRRPAP